MKKLQVIQCKIHEFKLTLPTTDEELFAGKYHDHVEQLSEHHDKFHCKFVEVRQ